MKGIRDKLVGGRTQPERSRVLIKFKRVNSLSGDIVFAAI